MSEKGQKDGSKKLVVLLVCLCLVICGLVVGIVIANNSRNESKDIYEEDGNAGLEALTIQENIDEKYDNDPDYSLVDAMSEYEYEMSVGSNAKRIYTAINYAEFIYDTYEDIDKVVGIMQKVEPLLDNNDLVVDYYVALRNFYAKNEDSEMEEYYNQKVTELLPKNSKPSEEMKPRERRNNE